MIYGSVVERISNKFLAAKIRKGGLITGAFALAFLLQSCGGGGGATSVNHAPSLGNPSISIAVPEGTTQSGNLNDALPSDIDGDAFTFNIRGALPAGFTYNQTSGVYSYAAPMVTANTDIIVKFDVTDTKGASSTIPITLTATSVDGAYDSPLSVQPITGSSTIGISANSTFQHIVTDADGILSHTSTVVDSGGNVVVTNAQLSANTVTTLGTNGRVTYDITILAGLLTAGTYTLKSTATGVNGGQNPSSQAQTSTKAITAVQDSPATVTYTGFTTTTTSISGNVACADSDGITSCENAITLNLISVVPSYTAFTNSAGGAVNFTGLTASTTYKIWIRTVSFNASTNNANYVNETSTLYTTLAANTAPTAQNVTLDLAYAAERVTYDLAPNISDTQTPDSGLTISVITSPTHGGLTWVTNTKFTYQATQGSGYLGNDSFTYKVVDPGNLTSTIKTVNINNIAENGTF